MYILPGNVQSTLETLKVIIIVARWPYMYLQDREIESDTSTTKSNHILTIERGCTLKLIKDILCILAVADQQIYN